MYNATIAAALHSYAPAHRPIPSTRRRMLLYRIIFLLAGCLTGSLAWSQQWTTAANQQEKAIDLLLQLNKKLEARQASIEKILCRKK